MVCLFGKKKNVQAKKNKKMKEEKKKEEEKIREPTLSPLLRLRSEKNRGEGFEGCFRIYRQNAIIFGRANCTMAEDHLQLNGQLGGNGEEASGWKGGGGGLELE